MPLPFHLIDGYNLLHAAGLSRETYGPGDHERARYALLIRIADGLDDAARERTTVVFDAFEPPIDASPRFRFREMTVQFAVESGEADQLIEELIRRHSSPRQLRVVSDDVRLKLAAKRRGAAAVTCEAFLRRLDRHVASRGRPAGRTSIDESPGGGTEDWSTFFGLSGDELKGDLRKQANSETPPEPPTESPNERRALPSARSRADATPSRSRKESPRHPVPVPGIEESESEPPAEDLSFWQRRIDEALAEERRRGPRLTDGEGPAESS